MELTVESIGRDRHLITARGHHVVVDQPKDAGGSDAGLTPTELFVASLAACVGHYARRALGGQSPGATVRCSWSMSDTPPWRVTDISLEVDVPPGTSPARHAAVQRAVDHCTVHNSLVDTPHITIEVPAPEGVAESAVA